MTWLDQFYDIHMKWHDAQEPPLGYISEMKQLMERRPQITIAAQDIVRETKAEIAKLLADSDEPTTQALLQIAVKLDKVIM